jgi:hypothetical protein
MSDYWLGLGTGINVAVLAMVAWDTLLDRLTPRFRPDAPMWHSDNHKEGDRG